MELGEKVKARRIALGLSQEELAKKIGLSTRFSISKIECGRPIKQDTVVKLADALNVSPSYLMGWADEEGNEIIDDPYDRLKRELGITNFTEDEKKEIINYIKYIISLRNK